MFKKFLKWIKSFFRHIEPEPQPKLDHSAAIEFMTNMKKNAISPTMPSELFRETPEQQAKRRFQETLELMKQKQREEEEQRNITKQ